MKITQLSDGGYRAEYTIMGRNYIQLFNKYGEHVSFVGPECESWKHNLLENIQAYEQEIIGDKSVRELIKNIVKRLNETKAIERKNLDQDNLISSLKIELHDTEEAVKKQSEELKQETVKTISERTALEAEAKKIEGGKCLLNLYREELPQNVPIEAFRTLGGNVIYNAIGKFFGIDGNSIELMLIFLKYYGKATTGNYSELVNDILKDKRARELLGEKLTNFSDQVQKAVEEKDLKYISFQSLGIPHGVEIDKIKDAVFGMVKDCFKDGNLDTSKALKSISNHKNDIKALLGRFSGGSDNDIKEFDEEYFKQLSQENPYLELDIDNIRQDNIFRKTSKNITDRYQERIAEENTKKHIKKLKRVLDKNNMMKYITIIIMSLSGLLMVICLIVSVIKFSTVTVKFESKIY